MSMKSDQVANALIGDVLNGQYRAGERLPSERDLVARFDAGTYVTLTDALSSHDVGRDRGGVEAALQGCPVPAVVGGITSDRLYPLRLQAELAELLGIGNILERFPQGLSGGERQRVALARALAFRPRLLCLDEPLAALDANTKSQITTLLKRVHRQEKVNVLHITHSPTEAVELGTLVFQMVDQRIIQTAL